MAHILRAELLGHPRLQYQNIDLDLRLKKARALLYYLLIKKSASREELAGLLWPDESRETAHRHLRDNLYYLRKVLPVKLIASIGRTSLQIDSEVQLQLDVDGFLSSTGVELYQSEFLTGFSIAGSGEYENWVRQMRLSLREQFLTRLEHLAQSAKASGDGPAAERYWQRYLEEEPYSELAAFGLMELYRSRSEYNQAAAVYRRLHKTLADDLGITPLKETSALYYAILNEWNRRAGNGASHANDLLIGRQDLLEALTGLFRQGMTHTTGPSFVLRGEPGAGKSYLLNYFLTHGDLPDCQVITGTCFKSKQEEYLFPWQSVTIALLNYIEKERIDIPAANFQAAAGLFPVFDLTGVLSVETREQLFQANLLSYESVLRIFSLASSKRPLLFVMEDIQWIDRSSLEMLDQLLYKLPSSRVAFAATCREPAGAEVEAFLQTAQKDGLLQCYTVSSFTREETMQFIEQFGPRDMSGALREQVARYSGGNAFLLVQLLNSIIERGEPEILPASLEDILTYRLSGLNDEGRQVLDLVAMFSGCAPYDALERISSKSPLDLLYTCQELCHRSIVSQIYDGDSLSLTFTQAEFQELVYQKIDPLKRRILHLNIANALAELSSTYSAVRNMEIVYHYQQGGDELNAFRYRIKRFKTYVYLNYIDLAGSPYSGETLLDSTPKSLRVFRQMEQELACLRDRYPDTKILDLQENELLYAKGCFCIYRGAYRQGTAAIQRLLDKPDLPDTTRELAYEQMIFYGIQVWRTDVMRENSEAALALTRGKDPIRHVIHRRYYGFLLIMEGRYQEGREELRRVLELLPELLPDELEARLQMSYAHNYIGESYYRQGMYERALKEYFQALKDTESSLSSLTKPIYYTNCAIASFAMGRYKEAKEYIEKADIAGGQLLERTWYSHALTRAYRALLLFAGRDYEICITELKQADDLAGMMGSPYEKGIVNMVKAILRLRCEQLALEEPNILMEPYQNYLDRAKALLKDRAGIFEQGLIDEISRGELSSVDGLWDR